VILFDVATGTYLRSLKGPGGTVIRVTFSRDSQLLAASTRAGESGVAVRVWELSAHKELAVRLRLWVAAVVVGFFAISHGHAHGAELPPGTDALLYSIGFVIATGCLHAVGICIGLIHRWPAGQMALRGAGVLVALAGVCFLWQAVA